MRESEREAMRGRENKITKPKVESKRERER